MKRLLLATLILTSVITFNAAPANAGFWADRAERIEQQRELKNTYAQVRDVILKQSEASNAHDIKALASFYTEKFVNTDGYNKKVYMQLVEDTWATYKDISYFVTIDEINIDDNFATVLTTEDAVATVTNDNDFIEATGELNSTGRCIYHLQKIGQDWKIRSEQILEEKTTLKYGDARYTKIDLIAPNQVPADEYYTASLKVDLPKDAIVIASIGKERMVHPQVKCDEVFRKLPEDQILERVFKSNDQNVNEYTVASVGITRSEKESENMYRVYMSGLAIVMTRVNIIPRNNFIKFEEKNAEKI